MRCLCVVSGGVGKRGRCHTETPTGQTILRPETRKPLADKITIELHNKLDGNQNDTHMNKKISRIGRLTVDTA